LLYWTVVCQMGLVAVTDLGGRFERLVFAGTFEQGLKPFPYFLVGIFQEYLTEFQTCSQSNKYALLI